MAINFSLLCTFIELLHFIAVFCCICRHITVIVVIVAVDSIYTKHKKGYTYKKTRDTKSNAQWNWKEKIHWLDQDQDLEQNFKEQGGDGDQKEKEEIEKQQESITATNNTTIDCHWEIIALPAIVIIFQHLLLIIYMFVNVLTQKIHSFILTSAVFQKSIVGLNLNLIHRIEIKLKTTLLKSLTQINFTTSKCIGKETQAFWTVRACKQTAGNTSIDSAVGAVVS